MKNSRAIRAFITYSREDAKHRDELRKYLAVMERQNKLVVWDDGQLASGDKTFQENILKKVVDSDMLLYLVSAASLASESLNRELAEALNRDMWVIPIILEPCDWIHDQLSNFQVLPDKGRPISEWYPTSKGWQNVVEGIRKVVDQIQPPSETELEVEKFLQAGNILLLFDQLDEAIAVYSEAIRLDPHFANAYNNRGTTYESKGDLDRAINDFAKAIELDPHFVDAYNNRGMTYEKKEEIDLALKDYNESIMLQPDYAVAYSNRGNVKLNLGEYESALADFDEAIRLEPDYAVAYSNRGNVKSQLGEYESALADFDRAIELNPSDAVAYSNRGNVKSQLGEYESALADFGRAIELNPSDAIAYNNQGNVKLNLGEYESALADFGRAIELNPSDAIAYNNQGNAKLNLGEYESALADFGRAIELNPSDAIAYNNQGNAKLNLGEYESALADFGRAIELNPDYVEAYNNRNTIVSEFMKREETIEPRIIYPKNKDETLEVDVVKEAEMSLNLEDPQLWDHANDGILEIQFNVFALPDYRHFLYCKVVEFHRESGEILDDADRPSSVFRLFSE